MNRHVSYFTVTMAISLLLAGASSARALEVEPLLPDQSQRKERPINEDRNYIVPEGFEIEEVASRDLIGSIVNMTFDHLGRPALSKEGGGIILLGDSDNDGIYDSTFEFATQVTTAHGMHYVGPGDLIVNSNGPEGAGLYRVTDTDNDGYADQIKNIGPSRGGIAEHGPHAILTGYDGALYEMYGNHSYPDVAIDPASPSRGLQEDQILERYVDPRGHATNIRAPGGVVMRIDPTTNTWSQYCGGFRNAFDFAINDIGEMFTFDSDMEWDVGLPWFRDVRLVHCVPGGDYGWRTGSGVFPGYYIDTLPSTEDLGRGSPVGICVYSHDTYPDKFRNAIFLGDWSRGRILVTFNRPMGATYDVKSVEFVLGQPLNVTDMEVGPDGCLYFSTGGRSTTGGLYRVKYTGAKNETSPAIENTVEAAIKQPMHRSAWGHFKIAELKKSLGDKWESELTGLLQNRRAPDWQRVRALELLQTHGPKPSLELLEKCRKDGSEKLRASAVLLMGTFPLEQSLKGLVQSLSDEDALVQRRACESLVRSGLSEESLARLSPPQSAAGRNPDQLVNALYETLDHRDRFVRYAARLALQRIDRSEWVDRIASESIKSHPRAALEGLVALIFSQTLASDSDLVFQKLLDYSLEEMDEPTRIRFLRTVQLAFLRDIVPASPGRAGVKDRLGRNLLAQYPSADQRVNREMETLFGAMQTSAAIGPMLARTAPDFSQQDQIWTVYALRSIKTGWTAAQRRQIVEWFDRARTFGGAASMEGYIENLWQSVLANLPTEEKKTAEARKDKALADRAARAAALAQKLEGETAPRKSDLAQMGFQELSEYLEFDPMTYEKANADRGQKVFQRAKCASCHIFGTEGKGGGPDLSNVVKRFRRREILEAIMYPSKVISDQYQAVNVDLTNNDTINGMLASESDTVLSLINAAGERIDIPKDQIKDRRPSTVSIMPEGLLETMTLGDLVDLIAFLERGSGL